MKFYCLLTFILFLSLSPALHAATPTADMEQSLIRVVMGVDFEGLKNLTAETILRESPLSTRVNHRTSLSQLDSDLKRLYALGYFESVQWKIKDNTNGIHIVFEVVENPVISMIEFQGSTIFHSAELESLLVSKKGAVLNYKSTQIDIEKIEARYHDAGYDLAQVKSVECDKATRTLRFNINEVRIESVSATGNLRTNDDVVLREMKSQEGTVYNSFQLRSDRNRILRLGYFSNVYPPELIPGNDASQIQVRIRVTEQKVNLLNFGAGFSETEPWLFFANLGFKNPFGTGEEIDLKSQFSSQKQTYSIQYYHPWVFRSPTRFTARVWDTFANEAISASQNVDVSRVGISAKFAYSINDHFDVMLIYKREGVNASSQNIRYQNNSLAFAAEYTDLQAGVLNYIHSGMQIRFKAEQGGNVLNVINLEGIEFARYDFNYNQFIPFFFDNQTIAIRFLGGFYNPKDFQNRPILEGDKYVVGGSTTLRGIADNSVLVRRGSIMTVANLEYRYAFSELLQCVLFVDAGDAFEQGAFKPESILISEGAGVRFTISNFTIRLDYGVIDTLSALHFSLGQMF